MGSSADTAIRYGKCFAAVSSGQNQANPVAWRVVKKCEQITFGSIHSGYFGLNILDSIALVVSLTALLAYLNHHYIRLPANMGVMLLALSASLLMVISQKLGVRIIETQVKVGNWRW